MLTEIEISELTELTNKCLKQNGEPRKNTDPKKLARIKELQEKQAATGPSVIDGRAVRNIKKGEIIINDREEYMNIPPNIIDCKATRDIKAGERLWPVETNPPADTQPEKPKKKKVKYAFPSKSRCPRCGSTQTVTLSTQKNVQYRKCQMAVCRWTYTVVGGKI